MTKYDLHLKKIVQNQLTLVYSQEITKEGKVGRGQDNNHGAHS